MQFKHFFLPLIATSAIASEIGETLPFSSVEDHDLVQLIGQNQAEQIEPVFSVNNSVSQEDMSPKTPQEGLPLPEKSEEETESTYVTLEEAVKMGMKVVHCQLRLYKIDDQEYFEQYVPGEGNQCGFFCFNTDRTEGMKKISEFANNNESVKNAIAQEIFRKFKSLDFSICPEDDIYTKECVESIGKLEERLTSEDPLIDKEHVKKGILKGESMLTKAAELYVDRYIHIFTCLPLMLEVDRTNHASLMDILAAALGYSLDIYIQETVREDGSIDPMAISLFHSFDPTTLGLEGPFTQKKVLLTNADKGEISAEIRRTPWRNHFNILELMPQ